MQQNRLGALLLECVEVKGKIRKVLYLTPAIIFLAIFAMSAPKQNDTIAKVILSIICLMFLAYILYIIFKMKHYDAWVYEKGLILKSGFQVLEWCFDDLNGIIDHNSSVLNPECRRNLITIIPKKGKIIQAGQYFIMPHISLFSQFRETLNSAHTKYLLEEMDNNQGNATFGNQLILQNGELIYTDHTGIKTALPFNKVMAVETEPESFGDIQYILLYEDTYGSQQILIIPGMVVANIDLLYLLIRGANLHCGTADCDGSDGSIR